MNQLYGILFLAFLGGCGALALRLALRELQMCAPPRSQPGTALPGWSGSWDHLNLIRVCSRLGCFVMLLAEKTRHLGAPQWPS